MRISVHLPRILSMAIFWSGCAIGPDYAPPEMKFPESFEASKSEVYKNEAPDHAWWSSFNDSLLDSLIRRAAASNKDVLQAVERVQQARALRRSALSELFPGLQLSGSYEEGKNSSTRFPSNNSSTAESSSSSASSSKGFEYEVYNAGMDALWEIDLFGRLRRGLEASNAELEQAHASIEESLRILIAEVGTTYFELRSNQQQLFIARSNVRIQEQSLRVAEAKLKFGQRGALDSAQAKAQLEATRAIVAPLEAEVAASMHRLAVLLGLQPNALQVELSPVQDIPRYAGAIKISAPQELLQRRPDIRIAERKIAAETARIGVKLGELFPKIELGGSLGVEAPELSSLTEGRGTYRWGPSITWTPFDVGRIRSQVHAQESKAVEAVLQYESSVLGALEDVENALARYSAEVIRYQSLSASFAASKQAFEISDAQYREGVIDFLSVLSSQETLLRSENDLVISRMRLAVYLVGIYKAFGGGWEDQLPAVS